VIKQVWSSGNGRCLGNKTNVIRWSNKFDEVAMKGSQLIKQMWSEHLPYYLFIKLVYYLFKLILLPDHICFLTRAPFITTWSILFYHLITFVLSPENLPIPLDQTCVITWSHLFYYPSTFNYHLIKLVLSPDHICFLTRAMFDQVVMEGARAIKQMWSGDKKGLIKR
jgi:hypothetical protein